MTHIGQQKASQTDLIGESLLWSCGYFFDEQHYIWNTDATLRQRNLEMQNAYLWQSGSRSLRRLWRCRHWSRLIKVTHGCCIISQNTYARNNRCTSSSEIRDTIVKPSLRKEGWNKWNSGNLTDGIAGSGRGLKLMRSFIEWFKFSNVCNVSDLKKNPVSSVA